MRPVSTFCVALVVLVCGALLPGLAASRSLPDFVDLVAENGPSVVNISTKQAPVTSQATARVFGSGSPGGQPSSGLLPALFR
jgi:hypothetical protein